MVGYHNDQYFNLDKAGEDVSRFTINSSGRSLTDADNPKFVYPDRTIRYGDGNTTYLKRGYIRSLMTYANSKVLGIRKCQFQFNPSELLQTVSANDSLLNFFQQDPAQYAQPMPGNVNFTFTLFFDRSMEVNNGTGKEVINVEYPWEKNDPSQVGVLRDIGAFFGVIGQGLSSHQVDYLTDVAQSLQGTIIKEAKTLSTAETPVDATTASSRVPEFLSHNIANSAFLLPLPIRIVFSSLYIVEGLVTNTTVQFTKFSTAMVPMMCSLNVTVEAKYIGFAQKNTFLTYVLKEREDAEKADLAASNAQINSVLAALNLFTTMEVGLTAPKSNIEEPSMDTVDYIDLDQMLYVDDSMDFVIRTRLKSSGFGSDTTKKVLGDLFDSAVGFGITAPSRIEIFGPYDASVIGHTEWSAAHLSQEGIKSTYTNTPPLRNAGGDTVSRTILNASHDSPTVSSNKDWLDMVSGAVRWDGLSASQKEDLTKHRASYLVQPRAGALTPTYYIIRYGGSVTATLPMASGESQTFVGKGETWELWGPGEVPTGHEMRRTISLNWTGPPDQVISTVTSVPPNNTATTQPVAGDQSKVGATPPKKVVPRLGPKVAD